MARAREAVAAFAGVRRVVFGASDPARGASDSLRHNDFYRSLGVEFLVGTLAAESQSLLDRYQAHPRPWTQRGTTAGRRAAAGSGRGWAW